VFYVKFLGPFQIVPIQIVFHKFWILFYSTATYVLNNTKSTKDEHIKQTLINMCIRFNKLANDNNMPRLSDHSISVSSSWMWINNKWGMVSIDNNYLHITRLACHPCVRKGGDRSRRTASRTDAALNGGTGWKAGEWFGLGKPGPFHPPVKHMYILLIP